eukprot:CAMPEP_0185756326 /NCGR_PEP_ID=MMETSP1174-20130828/14754_1 /TAXON_ID=35687 /ORGANISM="Dictyocha speculum, Strain CCMP1381" /LENGTH=87 /DNA_ID=CAMNT_0028435233 /DNA_START=33 /DNA_END=293 /DNA_ORIENTATION=-
MGAESPLMLCDQKRASTSPSESSIKDEFEKPKRPESRKINISGDLSEIQAAESRCIFGDRKRTLTSPSESSKKGKLERRCPESRKIY